MADPRGPPAITLADDSQGHQRPVSEVLEYFVGVSRHICIKRRFSPCTLRPSTSQSALR